MVTRRSILRGSLAAIPLAFLWRRTARAGGVSPYGELVADPDGIFDLPAGFQYRIVDRVGEAMTDGYRVPGRPDGMACFAGPGGTLALMRNHELSPGDRAQGPYGAGQGVPAQAYDADHVGGVTRVIVDAETGARVSSNLVLVGTERNCAGGVSPWGWLSCEEAAEEDSDNHGYVFVCAADADTVRAPQPVPGYGRFEHEAAAVDATTLIAYLTEDKNDSCFYRFVPSDPARPFEGTLQALAVVGSPGLDTSTGHAVGASWPITWVDVANPDPQGNDTVVRDQAQTLGAAIIKRGEGLWLHDGSAWFTATSGGPVGGGQIFRLDADGDGGTLTLVGQSENRDVLDMPDNITVAPWGEVFLCEDGSGTNHVKLLAADGAVSTFGRNALSDSELCGACFSPDGTILFVAIQNDGITLAITGPFPAAPEPDPDAGVVVVDAGPLGPDAGVPEGADAGAPGDAGGSGADDDTGGCGCAAGDDSGAGGLVVAAVTVGALVARRS